MEQRPTRQRYTKPTLRILGRMDVVTRKSAFSKLGNARDHETWEKNRANN